MAKHKSILDDLEQWLYFKGEKRINYVKKYHVNQTIKAFKEGSDQLHRSQWGRAEAIGFSYWEIVLDLLKGL